MYKLLNFLVINNFEPGDLLKMQGDHNFQEQVDCFEIDVLMYKKDQLPQVSRAKLAEVFLPTPKWRRVEMVS